MAGEVIQPDRSPFSQKRYENDAPHLYFLLPELLRRLEAPLPTYLVGTRGTGKTTLLKAMSAKERLHNESLKRQLRGEPFDGRYVGVYFKLPDTQLRLLDVWLAEVDDPTHESFVSFYLDAIALELLTEAIAELIVEGILAIPPEAEAAMLETALLDYRESEMFSEFMPPTSDLTTAGLWRAFRAMRRYLERCAARRLPVPDVANRLPMQQAGKLLRDLSPGLATLCSADGSAAWRFYVCMDEGEGISERQQLVLNTAVRLGAAPTFPIVAYVRAPSDSTLIPSQGLTRADREVMHLDDMRAPRFRKLVEGISAVRLRNQLDDESVGFDLAAVLGKSRLDDLLVAILSESEAPRARKLLEDARARAPQGERTLRRVTPPVIETYLVEKGVAGDVGASGGLEARRNASAHGRKLIVAAYLSICHEMRVMPRFASTAILLQLCDGCVRDYLWQMDEVFRATDLGVLDFLRSRVSDATQDAALRRASGSKFDRADETLFEDPEPAQRLVRALGEITAAVQSWSVDGSHLRSPERGIFVVKGVEDRRLGVRLTLLREAVESGYLQFTPQSTRTVWRFRLHTSLAPHFGFSYRGAYYPIGLSVTELNRLCYSERRTDLAAAIEATIRRVQGGAEGPAELPLRT